MFKSIDQLDPKLIDPKYRIKLARDTCTRPSIYPGDIVKARKRKDRPRDNRLFLVLEVGHRRHHWYDDCGSHDGEDYLRLKEYKKPNSKIRLIQRKAVWFTGKRLSL